MTPVSAAIYAVAKELAQKAKDSLPELRDGEQVLREWYTDGVYYETAYPLMSLLEYDSEDNTVSICSPYMVAIYERLMKPRPKTKKDGSAVLDRNKAPKPKENRHPGRIPGASYWVRSKGMRGHAGRALP